MHALLQVHAYAHTLVSLKKSISIAAALLFPKASRVSTWTTSSSPGCTVNSYKVHVGTMQVLEWQAYIDEQIWWSSINSKSAFIDKVETYICTQYTSAGVHFTHPALLHRHTYTDTTPVHTQYVCFSTLYQHNNMYVHPYVQTKHTQRATHYRPVLTWRSHLATTVMASVAKASVLTVCPTSWLLAGRWLPLREWE